MRFLSRHFVSKKSGLPTSQFRDKIFAENRVFKQLLQKRETGFANYCCKNKIVKQFLQKPDFETIIFTKIGFGKKKQKTDF